jgi:cytochrome c
MSTRNQAAALGLALALSIGVVPALADSPAAGSPNLGKPISESDVKNWDISVLPDGTNLPAGSGNPAQGAKIYAEKCVACHGEGGKGGVMPGAEDDRQLLRLSDHHLRLDQARHALYRAALLER